MNDIADCDVITAAYPGAYRLSRDSLESESAFLPEIFREGDPAGGRRWVTLPRPLTLEAGGLLAGVRIAYETWGTLAPDRSNAVLLLHGLTGDSHLAGPAGPGHPTPGWWDDLVGPGRPLDTSRWYLVVPNVLGGCQGSTGPASLAPDGRAWGGRFPFLTIRDQVDAEAALADELGIQRWAAVIGGSMGGMRALEWAVSYPDRVGSVIPIACSAASTADQIAWAAPQLQAIWDDPGWMDGDYHDAPAEFGPWRGLGTARRIAHITYRSRHELDLRFGRSPQPGRGTGLTGPVGTAGLPGGGGRDGLPGGDGLPRGGGLPGGGGLANRNGSAGADGLPGGGPGARRGGDQRSGSAVRPGQPAAGGPVPGPAISGRYAVESYLDHHADKLVRRFDAGSYVVLTQAMNSHDIGRGRGGVTRALGRVTARALVIGIDSDRLFPLPEQERIAEGLPGAGEVSVVASHRGHDGFLAELAQIGPMISDFLRDA